MPNKQLQRDVKKLSTQCSDNITDVYFRLDEPRVVACFRCNGKLWKTFKSTVKAQGLSICHVLEPMILGWLQGYVYVSNTIKPIKIENVVIERAVKRVRRYAVEDVDEFSGGVYCVLKQRLFRFDELKFLPCWFWKDCRCGNVHCWERVKPLIMQLRGSVNE